MIITVAGNINIPITDRHKEIVNKYEITFNEDDTIQSVRAQISNIRKQHRQLRRAYDTSNKNAVKSIHQTAAKIGGVIENLTFDDVSSIWKAILSIEETNEEDVVIGRKYTIHKKIDQSLKSCLLEKASLEKRLKAKVQILEDVYKMQLKVMLIECGFKDITGVEDLLLHKYLKKSQWCLKEAKEKIVLKLSSA